MPEPTDLVSRAEVLRLIAETRLPLTDAGRQDLGAREAYAAFNIGRLSMKLEQQVRNLKGVKR